ncbi:hypothetical protein [Paenarthrobacter ureafaciens]|uniref:hypothetical protein n=1 Tax=Paenarthrobacter ureafaciens TaxID=37931 RepID=UPI001FB247F0|nr:hypothetical protein [Paenarthrobacter ureafaciens]UOD80362.1 hypothetical protein MQZ73_14735 [Paenarthrobacter ureafaciens]WNZ03015.1 hypothetical protein PVT25_15375 [Paenarthrobacter ureafaciens]
MPTVPVTGNLREASGEHLVGKIPEIHFTLNAPNAKAGVMLPTEPVTVQPAADGSFTANLESTIDMLDDAWYTLSIQWLDAAGNYVKADFPDWQLHVPTGGGSFSDLFGRPPKNTAMVYVSLSAPSDPGKWTFWLKDDPANPANPLNTGQLYQWRKV